MEKLIAQYELIMTDGCAGSKEIFNTKEAARQRMIEMYNTLNVNKEDSEYAKRSYINDSSAVLYLPTEMFTFKIRQSVKMDCK